MTKHTALILDYDGCCCALDPSVMIGKKNIHGQYEPYIQVGEFYQRGKYAAHANYYKKWVPELFDIIKEQLETYFKGAIANAETVDLYVGSNRQSHSLDLHNAENNKNGSCFRVYEDYATSHNMTFQKLLLSDAEDEYGQLRPVDERQVTSMDSQPYDAPTCEFDKLKTRTLLIQLQDLAKRYPNPEDEIELTFIDDDEKNSIIPALLQSFAEIYQNPELRATLPQNVTIKCIKFDWFLALQELTQKFPDPSVANPGSETMKKAVREQFKAPQVFRWNASVVEERFSPFVGASEMAQWSSLFATTEDSVSEVPAESLSNKPW